VVHACGSKLATFIVSLLGQIALLGRDVYFHWVLDLVNSTCTQHTGVATKIYGVHTLLVVCSWLVITLERDIYIYIHTHINTKIVGWPLFSLYLYIYTHTHTSNFFFLSSWQEHYHPRGYCCVHHIEPRLAGSLYHDAKRYYCVASSRLVHHEHLFIYVI
jgi:hypothetical protein